jgi:tight adherence protein C
VEIALLGVLVAISVGMIIFALMPNDKNKKDAILRRISGRQGVNEKVDLERKAKESAGRQMMEKIAPVAMKPVMPTNAEELSLLRVKLSAAGYRAQNATTIFLASKTLLGVLFLVVSLIFTVSAGYATNQILTYVVFAGGLAFMAPNLWLSSAVKKRTDKIRCGLPDALDLMVVSVEAGLALDAAIQRVGDEMQAVHPIMAEEFQIATLETQMGIPRAEALDNLGMRSNLEEMKSLIAVVTQAEKFGTSVAKALRNQSDALRTKRRQAAEERAQKVAVKLMLPLILFIFPAIFVVLAGPAAIKIIRGFSEAQQ